MDRYSGGYDDINGHVITESTINGEECFMCKKCRVGQLKFPDDGAERTRDEVKSNMESLSCPPDDEDKEQITFF